MNNHYDLNDLGPSWELMKQDIPDYRLKTVQEMLAAKEEIKSPYRDLEQIRAKLTSWPALFSKRYEVARALALGWWYKHAAKDRATITENVVYVSFCFVMVVIAAWLALR